jgi:hypothetical protein
MRPKVGSPGCGRTTASNVVHFSSLSTSSS